jgi:hypothetical protein
MCFLTLGARVRRILGGLLALTLAFTNLSISRAASPPLGEAGIYKNHAIGIVNASFGLNNVCSLSAWTAVGSITTVPTDEGDCKAVLSADNSTVSRPAAVTTRLEQSFVVQGNSPRLRIYTNLTSNNPNGNFAAQTITIYNSSGQIISRHSMNAQGSFIYETYLNGYDGQTVTLSLDVNLDPTKPGSPTNASMAVDFYMLHTGPEPDMPPGGGW